MKTICILLAAALVGGCASKPLIDPKASTTPANYHLDEMECERISEGVSYGAEMAKSAALNGFISMLMGAALAKGTITPQTGAAAGLISGTAVGAGTGAYNTFDRRQKIVRKCLEGRGYKILE
jgi:outer membrane lipoprotein SlyB